MEMKDYSFGHFIASQCMLTMGTNDPIVSLEYSPFQE